jgi:hypothetical protein
MRAFLLEATRRGRVLKLVFDWLVLMVNTGA